MARNISTEPHVEDIQAAIDTLAEAEMSHMEDGEWERDEQGGLVEKPYCERLDGWFEYVVETADPPIGDAYDHWIDLSDISPDQREGASGWIHHYLAERGYVINAVQFDPPRLHVMDAHWLRKRLPGAVDA